MCAQKRCVVNVKLRRVHANHSEGFEALHVVLEFRPHVYTEVFPLGTTRATACRMIIGTSVPTTEYFYLTFQLGRERINVIIKGAETGEYR